MHVVSSDATLWANLNLALQTAMALALLGGMLLARSRHYRAHQYCQSAVVLLNLPLIAFIMLPSFHASVQPGIPGGLGDAFYAVAVIHAAIGAIAEVLGLYIILVAGTRLVPQPLRFRHYKRWMRSELVLWWVVVLIGLAVYAVWYVHS
jgi:uncharacterized membrane protein YozB (DUF420 family)